MERDEQLVLEGFATFNWMNVLPSVYGKRVLVCSPDNNALFEDAMWLHGAAQVNVEPLRPVLKGAFTSAARGNTDIFIVKAEEFNNEDISLAQFRAQMQNAANALNDGGLLLISFPSGMRLFQKKVLLNTYLKRSGFTNIEFYLCSPSCLEPLIIHPFTDDRKFTSKHLSGELFGQVGSPESMQQRLKNFIKYICARYFYKFNPFTGFMVAARKAEKRPCPVDVEARLRTYLGKGHAADKFHAIWLGKPLKHIGLLYRSDDKRELMAVCKRALASAHRSHCLREEHDKLQLLALHQAEYRKNRILVPRPVHFEERQGESVAVETAVPGGTLESLKWQLQHKKYSAGFVEKLDDLVQVQMYLQDTMSSRWRGAFPQLSCHYFRNTSAVSCSYFDRIGRTDPYDRFVQHGDFTDVNIMYSAEEGAWGIVDWEWAASGFPLLFDLFYLFTSLEFRAEKNRNEPLTMHLFASVIDTFFSDNHFTDCVERSVHRYCLHYGLPTDEVFGYFLDFLLFQYNKHKFDYHNHKYYSMYEECIRYALENKQRFIV